MALTPTSAKCHGTIIGWSVVMQSPSIDAGKKARANNILARNALGILRWGVAG